MSTYQNYLQTPNKDLLQSPMTYQNQNQIQNENQVESLTFRKLFNTYFNNLQLTNPLLSIGFKREDYEFEFKTFKNKTYFRSTLALFLFNITHFILFIVSTHKRYVLKNILILTASLLTVIYFLITASVFLTSSYKKLNVFLRFGSYFALIFLMLFIEIMQIVECKISKEINNNSLLDVLVTKYRFYYNYLIMLMFNLFFIINPSYLMIGGTVGSLLTVRIWGNIYLNEFYDYYILEITIVLLVLVIWQYIIQITNEYLRKSFIQTKQSLKLVDSYSTLIDTFDEFDRYNKSNIQYISFTNKEIIKANLSFESKIRERQLNIRKQSQNYDLSDRAIIIKDDYYNLIDSVFDYLNSFKITKLSEDFINIKDIQILNKLIENKYIDNIFTYETLFSLENRNENNFILTTETTNIKKDFISFKPSRNFTKIGLFTDNSSKEYLILYRKVQLINDDLSYIYDFLLEEIQSKQEKNKNNKQEKSNSNSNSLSSNNIRNQLNTITYLIDNIKTQVDSISIISIKDISMIKEKFEELKTVSDLLKSVNDDYKYDDSYIQSMNINQILSYIINYISSFNNNNNYLLNFTYINNDKYLNYLIKSNKQKLFLIFSSILNALCNKQLLFNNYDDNKVTLSSKVLPTDTSNFICLTFNVFNINISNNLTDNYLSYYKDQLNTLNIDFLYKISMNNLEMSIIFSNANEVKSIDNSSKVTSTINSSEINNTRKREVRFSDEFTYSPKRIRKNEEENDSNNSNDIDLNSNVILLIDKYSDIDSNKEILNMINEDSSLSNWRVYKYNINQIQNILIKYSNIKVIIFDELNENVLEEIIGLIDRNEYKPIIGFINRSLEKRNIKGVDIMFNKNSLTKDDYIRLIALNRIKEIKE